MTSASRESVSRELDCELRVPVAAPYRNGIGQQTKSELIVLMVRHYTFTTALFSLLTATEAIPRAQKVNYLRCQAGDKDFTYRVLAGAADPIQLWVGPDRWRLGGEGTFVADARMRYLEASDEYNYIFHWAEIDRVTGTYIYREGLERDPREERGTCELTTAPPPAPPPLPPVRKF